MKENLLQIKIANNGNVFCYNIKNKKICYKFKGK